MMSSQYVAEITELWEIDPRWRGIKRPYTADDVLRLRGSIRIEYTLARMGAERLWNLLHSEPYVAALGALTGNQAVQQVKAGLQAIYLSGWQVAADANLAGQMYPDQSLYPANSVPQVVRKINQALQRADQIQCAEGRGDTYWFAPIVADAEAGFGGPLNVFEMMKAMIEAGAAGVHFEDQLASEKKSDEFFATLFRLLQEQLGERLALPASAITEAVVEEHLRPRGVSETTLVPLQELFQTCNLARYAPIKTSQELAAIIPRLESVLRESAQKPVAQIVERVRPGYYQGGAPINAGAVRPASTTAAAWPAAGS